MGRYQTQRDAARRAPLRLDTHGLPAELEAMKQLGMTDKTQIEVMGIDKFNDACRASVMKYADEWKSYVTRRRAGWTSKRLQDAQRRVHGVQLWAFKQLHEKGLDRTTATVCCCWKDETPLSNHELRMDDDVYKNRQDQTVTVTFPITAGSRSCPGSSPRAGARPDHHAVDAAHQRSARRRAFHQATWSCPPDPTASRPPPADTRHRQLPARRRPARHLRQGSCHGDGARAPPRPRPRSPPPTPAPSSRA